MSHLKPLTISILLFFIGFVSFASSSGMTQTMRPFAEYEKTRTVVISSDSLFDEKYGSKQLKLDIAKYLSHETHLLILSLSPNQDVKKAIEMEFSQVRPKEHFSVIYSDFWGAPGFARDSLPHPAWILNDGKKTPSYYPNELEYNAPFELYPTLDQDPLIRGLALETPSSFVNIPRQGGNLLADSSGNCFMISSQEKPYTAELLKRRGCANVVVFKYLGGFGGLQHVDERVKILSDNIALTDAPEYVEQLEALGYTVKLLPLVNSWYSAQSYANALLVNNQLFLPIFDNPNDEKAVEIYESLGLEVYPLKNPDLYFSGGGGIHCLTMSYP